jgi:hypothetical protein
MTAADGETDTVAGGDRRSGTAETLSDTYANADITYLRWINNQAEGGRVRR